MSRFRTVPLYRWPNGYQMERLLFWEKDPTWLSQAGAGAPAGIPFQLVDRHGRLLAWAALRSDRESVQNLTDKDGPDEPISPDLVPYFVTFFFRYLGLSLNSGITALTRSDEFHVPWPLPVGSLPDPFSKWKDRANAVIGWNAGESFQALHYAMNIFPNWLGTGSGPESSIVSGPPGGTWKPFSVLKVDDTRISISSLHFQVFVEWTTSRRGRVEWRVSINRKGLDRAVWFPELYDALIAAPFTIEAGKVPAWVIEHGIEGEALFDLGSFRLLGLGTPVTWPADRFLAFLGEEQSP